VALQDDELAAALRSNVQRGFVAGDVFAEALQDVALLSF